MGKIISEKDGKIIRQRQRSQNYVSKEKTKLSQKQGMGKIVLESEKWRPHLRRSKRSASGLCHLIQSHKDG
jgi:hypothetical protein